MVVKNQSLFMVIPRRGKIIVLFVLDVRVTKEFLEFVKNKVNLVDYRQHLKMLEVGL